MATTSTATLLKAVYNRQHEAAGIVGSWWLSATLPLHHHSWATHALHQEQQDARLLGNGTR